MKKIIFIILLLITICTSYFLTREFNSFKHYVPKEEAKYMNEFDKLFPYFIINDVIAEGKPLTFAQYGADPKYSMYIVPKLALERSEVMIGYGIRDDISFEEDFSQIFNKHSYGYDCASPDIITKHPKCHFEKECIGTTKFALPDFECSGIIHTFDEILKRNDLTDKKIFIRMDIAGAETAVMDSILKYSKNITGLALVIHCDNLSQFKPTIKMLKNIEKNFVLVQRHTHPLHATYEKKTSISGKGFFAPSMSLSYINKNLIDKYNISPNQKSTKTSWENYNIEYYPTDIIMWRMIPTIILKNIQKLITFDIPKIFRKEKRHKQNETSKTNRNYSNIGCNNRVLFYS